MGFRIRLLQESRHHADDPAIASAHDRLVGSGPGVPQAEQRDYGAPDRLPERIGHDRKMILGQATSIGQRIENAHRDDGPALTADCEPEGA